MGLADLLGMGGMARPAGINPGLQQILAGLAGPQMTPPPAPVAGVSPTEQAIRAHIAGMPQQTFEPDPVPNAPKLWQRILAGLGDAMTVYGSGLGAPVPIGNASGAIGDVDRTRYETERANKRGQRETDASNARAKWELELRQLLGQKDTETEANRRAEDKAAKAQEIKDTRAYNEGQATVEYNRDLEKQRLDNEARLKLEQMQQSAETSRVRMREQIEAGSKVAKEQEARLGDAIEEANNFANNLGAILGSGDTPDVIRKKYQRELARLRLDPDARAIAEAYFEQEVGQDLSKVEAAEFAKTYENQGPEDTRGRDAALRNRALTGNRGR